MSAHFSEDGTDATAMLERRLGPWLRGFDTGEAPVSLRLRISHDLRAETEGTGPRLLRLVRGFGSIAAPAAILGGLALVLLASLQSVPASLVGGPTTPLLPDPTVPQSDLSMPSGGLNTILVAMLLATATLAAALVSTLPVRRFAGWVAGSEAPEPARRLPRSFAEIPAPAIVLALVGIGVMVWEYLLWDASGGASLDLYVSIFVTLAFAPAVALRYASHRRSGRWLLLGGLALLTAVLPGNLLDTAGYLGWFSGNDIGRPLSLLNPILASSLKAVGWWSLAIGIGLRSGVAGWPRRRVVALIAAAMAASLLWTATSAVDYAKAMVLSIGDVAQPEDLLRVGFSAISSQLVEFAWLWLFWVALMRCRRGAMGYGWGLLLAGAAVQLVLEAYLLMYQRTFAPWFGIQVVSDLWLLGLALLLLGLLVGLRPAVPEAVEAVDRANSEA